MGYTVSWEHPQEILRLNLTDPINRVELETLNQELTARLDEQDERIQLIVDASQLSVGYYTIDDIRTTQQYRDHHNLEAAYVVTQNKVTRLVMLVAFNLSRARFLHFNDLPALASYLNKSGYHSLIN